MNEDDDIENNYRVIFQRWRMNLQGWPRVGRKRSLPLIPQCY